MTTSHLIFLSYTHIFRLDVSCCWFSQEADVLSGDYYEAENAIVKDYLKAHSQWKVSEKPLTQDVVLTKQAGGAEVTVFFARQTEDLEGAMDQQQEEGQEEGQAEEKAPAPLLPFTVLIGKGDKGTLVFECVYRSGERLMQIHVRCQSNCLADLSSKA